MKTKNTLPPTASLQRLAVRLIFPGEIERFNAFLRKDHYLQSASSGGQTLRYVAEIDGHWCALLLWGSAAYRLKPRDLWLGWDATQRQQRLKLVAQNRRYLILPGIEMPNLASKALALCTKRLAQDWQERFGYRPLLAETFVGPEFCGTSYKAAGWERLGESAGYSRRAKDFYQDNGVAKAIWVKPLEREYRQKLHSPIGSLGKDEPPPAKGNSHGMPLSVERMGSLKDCFASLHDKRTRRGRRYPLSCVLAMIAMGIFAGKGDLKAIVRMAGHLNQHQLRALRSWKNPKTGLYESPSYFVFHTVLQNVDAQAFDRAVLGWLSQSEGALPSFIAIDGKTVRAAKDKEGRLLHLVAAVDHEDGRPLAQAATSFDEGKKNEITAGRALIEEMPALDNAIVTTDALHTNRSNARLIVQDKGGDYLFQVKGDQPKLLELIEKKFASPLATPFFSTRVGKTATADSKNA